MIGRDPICHVRRGEQEGADPDERGPVPHPIERGVVERPEFRHHGPAPRHLAVERVGDTAEEEQEAAKADLAERVGHRRDENESGPDRGDRVRPHSGPDQPLHDWVPPWRRMASPVHPAASRSCRSSGGRVGHRSADRWRGRKDNRQNPLGQSDLDPTSLPLNRRCGERRERRRNIVVRKATPDKAGTASSDP